MIELRYFFFFLSFIGFITATQLQFKPCSSDKGSVIDVTSEPCVKNGGNICAFQYGNTQQINITFIPDIDVTSADIDIDVTMPGFPPFHYPLPNSNICNNYLKCPLTAKQQYTAIYTLEINFPKINNLIIDYSLKDDKNNTIACFKIPVDVISNQENEDGNQSTKLPSESESTSTIITTKKITKSEIEVNKNTKQTTNLPYEDDSTSSINTTSNILEFETDSNKTSVYNESTYPIITTTDTPAHETESKKTSQNQIINLRNESISTIGITNILPDNITIFTDSPETNTPQQSHILQIDRNSDGNKTLYTVPEGDEDY